MGLRAAIRTIRQLLREERGNALALTALAMPLLIGSAGLAVDTISWVYSKRDLQGAVDAAALAGVYGLIQTGDMEEAVDRSLASAPEIDRRRAVTARQSPEGHEDDPFAVQVRVTSAARLYFSSMFLPNPPVITAEATATVVETGEFCAFAIGSGGETGIAIKPGANVEMDCGIATNSSSRDGIKADASATIAAKRLASFGGISGEGIKSSRVRSFALRQQDPLEDTEPPLIPNTGCPNVTVNPDAAQLNNGRLVLEPGCYGNMVVNGPVFLLDGEYILRRGSLIVGPTAELSCKACTIFLTSEDPAGNPGSIGKVQIDHHAKVKLAAPTQGPNAGILIYQDRHADGDYDSVENVIGGNSFSELKGLVYLPAEILRIDAVNNPDVQCARFIGKRLIFQGRVIIASGCSSANIMNFKGTEVKLVG
jgi:Flp pilus assembly protein TadG